jgi:hypothetical protein
VRTLSLRKEVLASLSEEDLAGVVGASPVTNTCVSVQCSGVTCLFSDVICLD